MEILNVGPLELLVILVLMFIILGPKDMVKTAQRIGRWVRSVTTSPMWREIWGISQDIRELPKKLMEDTGLEEALTDVKQTTQQVANELNAQINEAKEAARVPEVEHLRIQTNPFAAPPPGAVPAALPTAAEATPSADDAQPAVLEVAEPVPAAVEASAEPVATKKPRRKKQVETGEQQEVVKKPRRKKQPAAQEQPVVEEPAPGETIHAAEQSLQPDMQVSVEGSTNGSTPEAATMVEPVKKPRRRKPAQAVDQQPAVVQPPAAVDQPMEERPQVVEETPAAQVYPLPDQPTTSGLVEAETHSAPAAVKKTRRKKEAPSPVAENIVPPAEAVAVPAVEPVTISSAPPVPPERVPEPGPEKRRARARKMAPISTTPVESVEEAVVAANHGQPGKNGAEIETPQQPLPRKRRAPRSASIVQPTPPEPNDQNAA